MKKRIENVVLSKMDKCHSNELIVFEDDFSVKQPFCWELEKHSPPGYPEFRLHNKQLDLCVNHDKYLPVTMALSAFTLTMAFTIDSRFVKISKDTSVLRIFFSYCPKNRKGVSVSLVFNENRDGHLLLESVSEREKRVISATCLSSEIMSSILAAKEMALTMVSTGDDISIAIDGLHCFRHIFETRLKPGRFALSHGEFNGFCRISSLTIVTSETLQIEPIWESLIIPYNGRFNGLPEPLVWTIDAQRINEVVVMNVVLGGGSKSVENLPWFTYHARYIDNLKAPYLRLENDNGFFAELLMSHDELSLWNPPENNKAFYLLGKKPVSWPMKKTFYLKELPKDSRIIAGYEYYNADRTSPNLAGGPYEAIFDPLQKRVVREGETIARDAFVVTLKSSLDKRIVGKIPLDIPEYENAVAFARKNHFFYEGEAIVFSIEIMTESNAFELDFNIRYTLEDAYFEPLEVAREASVRQEPCSLSALAKRFNSEPVVFSSLKVGVYHLRYELYFGGEVVKRACQAFEVMDENGEITPQQASGLPMILSFATEVMNLKTDQFDPFLPGVNNESHYVSCSSEIMPHAAREKQWWRLTRLYQRRWRLPLFSRTVEDYSIATNADLVAECDDIVWDEPEMEQFWSMLGLRMFYRQPVILNALEAFSRKMQFPVNSPLSINALKILRDNDELISLKAFQYLVSNYWYEWLDSYADFYFKIVKRTKDEVKELNPSAKFSPYNKLAMPPYASGYVSGGHSMGQRGVNTARKSDLKAVYDGFISISNYTYCCLHNLNRLTSIMASAKLYFPTLTFYPEYYHTSGKGKGCPDGAVFHAWPPNGVAPEEPAGFMRKRLWDYAFATVWHDGQHFNYIRDYGLQTRIWDRDKYRNMLKAWKYVVDHPPLRPLKASAFIHNEACFRANPVRYDETEECVGDLCNTAEESVTFAYEMSRIAGLNAGFILDFPGLSELGPDDIDVLVLPPMTGAQQEDIDAIRRLAAAGVSLLAFEDVSGLEDLFGVQAVKPCVVRNISVNTELKNNPLMQLFPNSEYTENPDCIGKYESNGAMVSLVGDTLPVLFIHRTGNCRTALFNIPPTLIHRQRSKALSYGHESTSDFMMKATQEIVAYLSTPLVSVDSGKLIAFEDKIGNTVIIIEEDAFPKEGCRISPLLTIRKEVNPDSIHCDKPFNIIENGQKQTIIRLNLDVNESAFFTIKNEE